MNATMLSLEVEHVPQHVERHLPGPAVTGADWCGALVDAHDHAGDAMAAAIIERDGVTTLDLAPLGSRREGLRRRFVGACSARRSESEKPASPRRGSSRFA